MKNILISVLLFISLQSFGQIDSLKLKTALSLQARDWLFFNSILKNSHDFENVYDSVKAKLRITVAPTLTTVIKVDSIRNEQVIQLANYIKSLSYGNIAIPYTRINSALRSTPYLIAKIDGIDTDYTNAYNTRVQTELDDLRSVLRP